jgi:hypothetical protein
VPLGYGRSISPRRADLLLALALAVPSVFQALKWPITDQPALSIAIALVATLPIALRRTHPVPATLAGTVPWLVPTDGDFVVGYLAALVLYYSLAVYTPKPRTVVLVTAFGTGVSILHSYLTHVVPGEYAAAVTAVIVPVIAGRVVRHTRAQNARLQELTAALAA